jgi:hypothetical protein
MYSLDLMLRLRGTCVVASNRAHRVRGGKNRLTPGNNCLDGDFTSDLPKRLRSKNSKKAKQISHFSAGAMGLCSSWHKHCLTSTRKLNL